MRDDFSKLTKEVLAKRVSFKCSNPNCKKITVGPHSSNDKAVNIGVAAHISAASVGGPRFSKEMKPVDRKSIKNGIWLCQSCSKLIDVDTQTYSTEELLRWKSLAEKESLSVITNKYVEENKSSTLFDKRIKVCEQLFYEIQQVNSLINELIEAKNISKKEKRETGFYLGLRIAQFTEDNDFYLQQEVTVQCVGTFVIVGDLFSSDKTIREETLEDYRRNIRASQKLLKSVNSEGLIDLTKKTPLMSYFSKLAAEASKDDFI